MSKLSGIIMAILIQWTQGNILETSANYMKDQMERNNIVNKKVWVRNEHENGTPELGAHLGRFIFHPESFDRDGGLTQNMFDNFGESDALLVSGFLHRSRRSAKTRTNKRAELPKKLMSKKIEDVIKSKIVSELKPSTFFNEYPYAVALLLSNAEKGCNKVSQKKNINNNTDDPKDTLKLAKNSTTMTGLSDYDTRGPKFNVIEDSNEVNDNTNTLTRSIYDKETIWNENNAPISDSNIYKVVTDQTGDKPKGITERGLVKVIAMLTKSFKRIMKHYKEILDMHSHIIKVTQEFDAKAAEVYAKFEDFDSKYADMIQFSNKVNDIGAKMNAAQEYLQQKYKKVETTLTDFQAQQNTFLNQQKQFLRLQKQMAAQNEKINAKQNQIAKTQSEISHRQNNFARILKKAKEVFFDKKMNNTTAPETENRTEASNYKVEPIESLSSPQSMKINLFSIPPKSKIQENQDDMIIKEKDEKGIDELVYKYYFNNTFIDNLMKTKVLNNYASQGQNIEVARRAKSKRNGLVSTPMLPLRTNSTNEPSGRIKRWINAFGKKYKKLQLKNAKRDDSKAHNDKADTTYDQLGATGNKADPYKAMATAFCKEVRKNGDEQTLKWCVEKSLRRLKVMDMMTHAPQAVTLMSEKPQPYTEAAEKSTERITTLRAVPSKSTTLMYTQDLTTIRKPYTISLNPVTSVQTVFFPDNEELESNLKQYEIKPDTEGNVYYDGSLHISDLGRLVQSSEGTSDMIDLVGSNSQAEIDTRALDLQAMKRAYVNRFNGGMMRNLRL